MPHSPVHRHIQNNIDNNIKNKNKFKQNGSPERKLTIISNSNLIENVTKTTNLTIISHGDRNLIPRSISPVVNITNFNNSTNSIKESNQNFPNSNNNSTNINGNSKISTNNTHNINEKIINFDKNSSIKERRPSNNNPQKITSKPASAQNTIIKKNNDINIIKKNVNSSNSSSTNNSNNVTPNQNLKKIGKDIPILIDLKKEKSPLTIHIDTDKKNIVQNFNKSNLVAEKKIEKKNSNISEKDRKNLEISNNKVTNYNNQKLPEKLSLERLTIDISKKDNKSQLNSNKSNKTKISMVRSEKDSFSNEFDNITHTKQSEFASCAVSDIPEIQNKLSKYCEENNFILKDVDILLKVGWKFKIRMSE